MKVSAVGIPWYHEADYNGLREIFEDGNKLAATYHGWLESANGVYEHIKSEGMIVEKVYITLQDFPAWCAARNLRLNAHARNEFAGEFVARKHGNVS